MELPEYETNMRMVRKKLDEVGKNPIDLADQIDVDPTTVNRYLNGTVEAPYENLRAIWRVLREWESEQTQPAEELMIAEFTSTHLTETRREAADKMIEGDFCQLPVREHKDGEIVGIVTDADLMKVHDDERAISEIDYHHLIRVERDTSRQLVEDILDEEHSAVLVVDNGSPVGFITKYDLLMEGPKLGPTGDTETEDSG